MEQAELLALLSTPKELVDKITKLAKELPDSAINYYPEDQKIVKDLNYRPDRKVQVPDGNGGERTEIKPVHRIPSATRQIITDWSVDLALSAGVGIECTPNTSVEETMLAMIKKTINDNKLDFLAQEIERLKQRYLVVLLVWYSVEAEPDYWGDLAPNSGFKMRCTILSPEDGSIIIPIRDQYKDMIGAARKYKVTIGDKDVEKMDLFLNDRYDTYIAGEQGWALEKTTPIPYGKANFILDEQERTETADIEAKLDRINEIMSDSADENQQSAFPILAAFGDITAAQGGGANTRKVMQLENGANLRYIEANGSQERQVNELSNLRNDVFMETSTPYFKFEDISGNIPGITMEVMMLPATNKAKRKQQGSIGIFHQRNLNFLKSAMAIINTKVAPALGLVIKPSFKIVLPRNKSEEVTNVVALLGAGLISRPTAIKILEFTNDPDAELELIEEEIAKRTPNPPA